MLDGLLGRGFSSKCKSLIKLTRTRIDVVRRRKEATQRFLKGNLAQLLANGLDINAFGRTEEFLAGLNLLWCYDFIEQSCEYVLKKLSTMQKQRECPEECREAVGSLMFAAARFSDLPELRDLRDALQERYGSSLEHYVNREFVERLALKPPTIEKKIELLQDIALESSIKWDARGFQRTMTNPLNQPKKPEVNRDHGNIHNLRPIEGTAVEQDQLFKQKVGLTRDRLQARNGGENYPARKNELDHRLSAGYNTKPHMGSETNTPKRQNYDINLRERREQGEPSCDRLRAKNCRETPLVRNDELDEPSLGASELTGNNGRRYVEIEQKTPRIDNYHITPRGTREQAELSSHWLHAKNDRETSLMRKGELNDQSFKGDESTGRSRKLYVGSGQSTPRRENYVITSRRGGEIPDYKNEPTKINGKEGSLQRRDIHGISSHGKGPEVSDALFRVPNSRVDDFPGKNSYDCVSDEKLYKFQNVRDGKNSSAAGYEDYNLPNTAKSSKIHQESDTERVENKSSYPLPPPYVKPKDKLVPPPYMKSSEAKRPSSDHDGASLNPISRKREDPEVGLEKNRLEDGHIRHKNERGHNHEKSVVYRDDIPLPRPRSIRKKHLKSSSSRDDPDDSEDSEVVKRSSSSRRRNHHSKKGLQILFDNEHKQRDEDEKMIDKLLLHYSKKPSTYEQGKVRRKAKSHHAHEGSNEELTEGERASIPTRSVSLPREQNDSKEQVKVYARANSFQPDKAAGHVHPKLPDYDDLAAQFAALKGR